MYDYNVVTLFFFKFSQSSRWDGLQWLKHLHVIVKVRETQKITVRTH